MPLWLRVAIYFLSSVVGLSVAWMTLIALSWTVAGRILRRVPSIIFDLTGAFASLLTTYCLVIFQKRSINIFSISSVFIYVFYIVIIVHVSIFLWSVIIPKILLEIRSRDNFLALKPIDEVVETDETAKHEASVPPVQNSSDENRTVVVGNSRILLTSIQHISAEGNYVRVHTSNSSYFEAATMKMVLSQVPVNLGLRTHRSHWVSYSAIHSVESDGRTLKVNLTSGVQVPVSRSNLGRVKRLASPDNTVECK
ncbi:LytTr DNA-binding region [Asticcacaulis excentricus CB 48]|uniref:LytTr DNA-binding region n=2 Tax=Asticcacaulis excentricus TaxID=78587 RepID=E8RUH8_ASTEC|nr:LytTr DNA-binding region [Asticcacaulis excentricus CB 48]